MRKELTLITIIILLGSMFILSSCSSNIISGKQGKTSLVYGHSLFSSNNKIFIVIDVNDSFELHVEGHYFKKNVSDQLPEISLFLNYSEDLKLLNEKDVTNFKFNEKYIDNKYYEFNSKENIKFIAPRAGNFQICSESILNGSDIFYNKDPINKFSSCVHICAIEKHQDYEDYCFEDYIKANGHITKVEERHIDFLTKFDFSELLKKLFDARYLVKSNS